VVTCLLLPSGAGAAGFSYTSQTGQVSTQNCESDTQDIVGVADASVVAVSDQCPLPIYGFAARSAIDTQLGAGQLVVDQQAQAYGEYDLGGWPTGATALANLNIQLILDEATTVRIDWDIDPPTSIPWQDQPDFWLTNQSEGWSVGLWGNEATTTCGTLSAEDCAALTAIFFSPDGLLIPAGAYEFGLDAFAFTPEGSCSRGCREMGSIITLSIIPEPETGGLLGAGLAIMAGWLRIRRRPRRP
jgi:hypothetical protein